MPSGEKTQLRPHLSVLAMISFIVSFLIARLFTTLYPDIILVSSSLHVHHFWFGLAMLAIGGWLGISYQDERTNRLAAILFGAGGGLIGDEVGLLLTFGNYSTEITYTIVIVFVVFSSLLILLWKYSKIIYPEFAMFLSSNAGLYFGVFLAAVSIAFVSETDNIEIIVISIAGTIAAIAIIIAYLVRRIIKSGRL
jgi:hypothetical protein